MGEYARPKRCLHQVAGQLGLLGALQLSEPSGGDQLVEPEGSTNSVRGH